MEVAINWEKGLVFSGTAARAEGDPLPPLVTLDGHDGLKPIELVALGLVGCTAMDVISILQKKQQDVTGFEVKAHIERSADHPKVYTDVVIEYIVRGRHVNPAAVERAIELSATKYCAVQAMLSKAVPIHHTYRIVEG
ncbi:MAG: OsmC family protein [Chloroflexota bacterium]